MGYTHYYTQDRTYSQEEWDGFIKDVKHLFKNLPERVLDGEPIFIAGCSRYKNAVVNKHRVWFNGANGNPRRKIDGNWEDCPATDQGHETFVLERVQPKPAYTGARPGTYFCKTARKPYDLVVCAVLILAHVHLGLQVSSDGDWSEQHEWVPARVLVAKLFPETAMEIELDGNLLEE